MDENLSEGFTAPATCWDDLPYMTTLQHTCGCVVEIHTLVRPDTMEFAPLTTYPCLWHVAMGQGHEESELRTHLHFMYRRGEAVIRRGGLRVEDYQSLAEWEAELGNEPPQVIPDGE